MADLTLFDIVLFLDNHFVPLMGLVAVVLGIMAALGRKETRLLGAWGALSGLSALNTSVTNYVSYLYMTDRLDVYFYAGDAYTAIRLVTAFSGAVLGILAVIVLWLHLKRSYGTNPVPLILGIVAVFVTPVIMIILNRVLYNQDRNSDYVVSVIIMCTSSLISLAINIMFLVIFLKNKSIEKGAPNFWLFFLLLTLRLPISLITTIGSIKYQDSEGYQMLMMLLTMLLSVILPAACWYLFKRSRVEAADAENMGNVI